MEHLVRLSLRSPRATLLLLGGLTLCFAAGLPRVERAYGLEALLGKTHPAVVEQERFVATYGGGYPLLVVWECGAGRPCRDALDAGSLAVAHELERRVGGLGGVRSVWGPATSGLLVPDASGFLRRRFTGEDGRRAPDADALARRARRDPLWRRHLVSEDGRVAAVTIVPADTSSPVMERIVDVVLETLAPYEARGFAFKLAGHPAESVLNGRDLADSTARATPLCVVIIAVASFALLRCWRSVLASLLTVGTSVLWAFGLLGWLGWPQEYVLQVLAPLLLVVGVCDAVHLLARVARENAKADSQTALLRAARAVGPACAVTTLTTAAAFLSFTASPLEGFRRFGLVAGFGVTVCLLLTFTLLPLLARWLPPSMSAAEPALRASGAGLRRLGHASAGLARPVLAATALLFAAGVAGWGLLRVDTDIDRMFGEDNRVVRWSRFVDANLRGLDSLEIEVALPDAGLLFEPSTQAGILRLERHLAAQPELGVATSARTLLARANRLLHDDDPAWERTGESAAANAQLLELVAMGDPEGLGAWVAHDRRRLRVSAEAQADSSAGRGAVLTRVRAFLASELPESWAFTLTGPFAMEFRWAADLQRSQLRSFALALLLVFALVSAYLRSLRLGLAALVPAVLPVVAMLGFMGYAGLLLDVGRCLVAAIVIGIAVDDAVHVLGQYQQRRRRGAAPADALEDALEQTGPAVLVTSVALSLGFLALSRSAWASIASFGALVSVAILGALAATLFVMPPVVLWLEGALGRADSRPLCLPPRPASTPPPGNSGQRSALSLPRP